MCREVKPHNELLQLLRVYWAPLALKASLLQQCDDNYALLALPHPLIPVTSSQYSEARGFDTYEHDMSRRLEQGSRNETK